MRKFIIKKIIQYLVVIAAIFISVLMLTGCNTKKRLIQNNDVNISHSDHKDSIKVTDKTEKIDFSEIIEENLNISKDVEITFDGVIEQTDKEGNVTKLNGTLNITQKEEDRSKRNNNTTNTEERGDSAIVNVVQHNDSTHLDKTIKEDHRKMSATPTFAIIGLIILGALMAVAVYWWVRSHYKR